VLWAGGNRWKSRGAQPKQTDVRINIAKEQPRFEFLPYACQAAGAILRGAATSKTFPATLTTIALNDSSLQWFETY
jgi:hypothetical protein